MRQRTPLTEQRWTLIESIFHQAIQEKEPARRLLVARLCGDDADLFEEVEEILASFDTPDEAPVAYPASRSLVGTRLGSYRLDRLLGQGGMSSVYLAHRDDGQYDWEVAVKLMSPHLASEFFTERFRRERQILADLDHPNTTRLIDGGVTENGDPYLVMEYVDGQPLGRYCDEHRLSVAERIRLLIPICSALAYAHARQIAHRDVKPSNILISEGGVPKLLDFGTAKLLSREDAESATTRFGLMTLRYASPEQLRGEALTEATDIYSLGVTLYELVTGAWPFGNPESFLAGLDRAVHDLKPAPPAEVIRDASAEARSTTKLQLIAEIRGDLERILSKALQSRPDDRYSSIEDFARDLQLYLDGKPLAVAVRPAWWNRLPIRIALASVAAVIIGAGLPYFAQRRAQSEREGRFIAVLPFVAQDPNGQYLAQGLTADIGDALSRNSALRLIAPASASRFDGSHPDLRQINRQLKVGLVLTGYLHRRSGDFLEIFVQLQRAPGGARVWSHTYEVQSVHLFAVQSDVVSNIAHRLKISSQVAGRNAHVPNPEAYEAVIRGRYDFQQMTVESMRQAQAEFQHAIELDPQYAAAYLGLGNIAYSAYGARGSGYRTETERRSAEAMFRKALELDPDLSSAHVGLAALAMQYDWNWDGAERELRLAATGRSNPTAESFYSFLLIFRGRFAEAEWHLRRLLELDPFSVTTLNNLALMRNVEGRFAESQEAAKRLLAISPNMLSAQMITCQNYIQEGRTDLALPLIRRLERRFPEAQFLEAMALAKSGRKSEALRLIRPWEQAVPNGKMAMQWFAVVYAMMGDEPNTVKWLERSADRHEFQVLNIAVVPIYASMENSPGFRGLKKRIGLER